MSENVTAIARLLSGLTHYSTRPHLVTHFVLLFQLPTFRVWLNSLTLSDAGVWRLNLGIRPPTYLMYF